MKRNSRKRLISKLLAFLMVVLYVCPVYGSDTGGGLPREEEPQLLSSVPVTSGVLKKEYRWELPAGPANIYVLEIDLTNPHVRVDVIPGAGKLTQRLNVSAMAAESGAVAAVNGDFYNTQAEGAPIGPMVKEGRLLSSPSVLTGIYALGITYDNRAVIEAFSFTGSVTAPDGSSFPLAGLNKTVYWEEPDSHHSHIDRLHLYNDMWGGKTRGHDSYTTPTEVLVDGGRVVDVVHGQYFDFPVPEGMQILRGHGKAAEFLSGLVIGDYLEIDYELAPDRDWKMIVGGHALLVDEGKVVPYTKDISALGGVRARTAAGVSRDGSTLYLVGVEGRRPESAGLSLGNLSAFLEKLGVYRAVNLDGGGSATMVARPLGEFQTRRVYTPEQVNERLVVNAIGVFSSAPQGKPAGLIISGPEVLLIGEEAVYAAKAFDEYYNPLVAEELDIKWSIAGSAEVRDGNEIVAEIPGTYLVEAKVQEVTTSLPLEVVGRHGVNALLLSASTGSFVPGEEVPLKLELETVSGIRRTVPAHLAEWELYGFDGIVSKEGVLIIEEPGQTYGMVVARYQGFSAPLVITFNEEPSDIEEQPVSLVLTVGERVLHVNGEQMEMDVEPVIMDGRTLVPVRFVSEALSAQVNWNDLTRNVTLVQGKKWLDLWPGEPFMVVDGLRHDLDVPPQIINSRTMLPLRAVSQALGLFVHWDAATQRITLYN